MRVVGASDILAASIAISVDVVLLPRGSWLLL